MTARGYTCRAAIPVVALCVLLGAITTSAAAQPAAPAPAKVEARLQAALAAAGPDEWIGINITLRDDDIPPPGAARWSAVAQRQQRVLDALPGGTFQLKRRYQALAGMSGWARLAAVEALAKRSEVRSLYLDGRLWPALSQGVPLVGADDAHALGLTGAGVAVAVLDSGLDTDHPDLADDLLAEQCYCSDSHPSPQIGSPCCPGGGETQSGPGAAEDDTGHGTSVSGIVTSGGTNAPLGVAPDAGLVAVRVGGPAGSLFSDVAAGLDWVLVNRNAFADPIKVVNLSLSDGGEHSDPSIALCDTSNTANAIAALQAAGVVTFVASGNDGHDDGISFPACVAEAISVGGVYDASFASVTWCSASGCSPGLCTDTNVGPDDFVCHTNSDELLDLLAPDHRTATTGLFGGVQQFFGGTSAASPYAAAQAALLFEADPSLTPAEILSLLTSSGTQVTNPDNGLEFPRPDIGEIAGVLLAVCGNGALEVGEQCDDGGTAAGDCCAADCQFEAAASPCDDADACTTPDTCDGAGACVGGAPLVCQDANICTDDSCNPASGCVFAPNTGPCDDADACTTADTCDGAGACQGGPPPSCDDGDVCTAESCDAIEGCVSTPIEGCSLVVPAIPGAALPALAALLAALGSVLARRR